MNFWEEDVTIAIFFLRNSSSHNFEEMFKIVADEEVNQKLQNCGKDSKQGYEKPLWHMGNRLSWEPDLSQSMRREVHGDEERHKTSPFVSCKSYSTSWLYLVEMINI